MPQHCKQFTYDPVSNLGDPHVVESNSMFHNFDMMVHNSDINGELQERSVNKTTVLFYDAVRRGDLNHARLLHIYHEVDANSLIGNKGEVALHIACKKGHKDLVQWLLNTAQVDIEKPGNFSWYRRAIHCATLGCHPEILELLLKKGAQLDSKNIFQETAIHIAMSRGYTKCSRLLIKYGCDLSLQDWSGNTPLHYAILSNAAFDMIQLLVSNLGTFLETKNECGQTALLVACHQKNYAAIELLVEAGADLQAVDRAGNSALILAVSKPKEAIFKSVPVKELSPSIFEFYQNPEDKSLKEVMKREPIVSLFSYLIHRGCSWEATNIYGKKAADIFFQEKCPQFIIDVLNRMAAKWKIQSQSVYLSVAPLNNLFPPGWAATRPLHDSTADNSNSSDVQLIPPSHPATLAKEQLKLAIADPSSERSKKTGSNPVRRKRAPAASSKDSGGCSNQLSNSRTRRSSNRSYEKCSNHKSSERERRKNIQNAFEFLRSCIPELEAVDRATKVVILQKAIQTCQSLMAEEKQHLLDIDALKKQQNILRKRIVLPEYFN